jgi:hypothetical protein
MNPPADTTRQVLFSIPFYLNTNVPPPAEVQLYVSGDQGRSWSLYQRRQPQQGKFDFQAGQDGEYWFVVRTNDDRDLPTSTTRPEKIVIVDRAEPELSLDVRLGATGELVATYRAEDLSLDIGSLRLEYRLSETDPWRPVPVDRTPDVQPVNRKQLEGKTSWAALEPFEVLRIRAEIADRAGNRRELFKSVDFRPQTASMAQGQTTNPGAAGNPPAAASPLNTPADSGRLPWLADSTSTSSPDHPTGSFDASGWRTDDAMLPQVTNVTPAPSASAPLAPAEHPDVRQSPPRVTPSAPTLEAAAEGPESMKPALTDNYAPPIANRVGTSEPPLRPDIQMTNSRRFNLDYDVPAGIGQASVARVELWVTENGGNTWQPFGVDRDLRSPFLVELDHEGEFGFRLLIHDQQGISARPPQAGDEADLWIGLDWTPPRAQLVKADVVPGSPSETVTLHWQAEDDHLADRPIRISYAPGPDGPWSVIAHDLPNTGSYSWVLAQPLPARTYLQLEVVDRAGNVTSDRLINPIGSGAEGPKAMIRGIRQVEPASPAAK